MEPEETTLKVRLPAKLKQELIEVAKEQYADASTLARQAIARAIADHEETKRQKEAAA